jgi:HEPN domain-containing protein
MKAATRQWLAIAEDDLDAAVGMLETGRFLYAVFEAQQAAEKALKAMIQEEGKVPPRIHDLEALAARVGVSGEDWVAKLGRLSSYYVATRYPRERDKLKQATTRAIAEELLDAARWCCEWAKGRLTSGNS